MVPGRPHEREAVVELAAPHGAREVGEAAGRIVAVLEGGYDLDAVSDGVAAVLEVLRGGTASPPLATGNAHRADGVLARVRAAQSPYWTL